MSAYECNKCGSIIAGNEVCACIAERPESLAAELAKPIAGANPQRAALDRQMQRLDELTELARLRAELAALREENGKNLAAIRWALGEEGEFADRPAGKGAYWWRTELRARSSLPNSKGEG